MKGQPAGQSAHRHRAIRLGEHIHSTGIEGIHRHLRTGLRQRTDNHHRHGMMLHEDPQECQPVHAGHFQVERDHIGIEPHDLLAGHIGIAGRSHHFDLGILIEGIGDRLAHQRRIVHDEHAEPGGRLEDAHGSPCRMLEKRP